jgi:hypothetical protein
MHAFDLWIDAAETLRAAAAESRGEHGAVKELRDLARNAEKRAISLLGASREEGAA